MEGTVAPPAPVVVPPPAAPVTPPAAGTPAPAAGPAIAPPNGNQYAQMFGALASLIPAGMNANTKANQTALDTYRASLAGYSQETAQEGQPNDETRRG
jgi:hypothetical protein